MATNEGTTPCANDCAVCHERPRYCRACGGLLSPDGLCDYCDSDYLSTHGE